MGVLDKYSCDGQMNIFDIMPKEPIWKRYPGCNIGLCPNCGKEVYYDAAYGRGDKSDNWNSIEYDFTGIKECPNCGTKFNPDSEFPYGDYEKAPLISGIDDKPIEDFEPNNKVSLPLGKKYCSIRGADCNLHTYKGCKNTNECPYISDALADKYNCKFSNHICNKENLWMVADTLDDIECPHKCCRECNQPGCGSRCNGSEEPKICDENCSECKKYESERMSFDGKRITYSCAVASKTVVKNIPCGRTCDVEWCSRTCFERLGYQWDYSNRGWLKGSDGKALISSVKECDWEPHNKESEYDVKFEDFKEHCTHNGWIKGEEDADGNNHAVTMCSYANGKKATCWSDWVPCTEENCEIVRKVKSNVKNSD